MYFESVVYVSLFFHIMLLISQLHESVLYVTYFVRICLHVNLIHSSKTKTTKQNKKILARTTVQSPSLQPPSDHYFTIVIFRFKLLNRNKYWQAILLTAKDGQREKIGPQVLGPYRDGTSLCYFITVVYTDDVKDFYR